VSGVGGGGGQGSPPNRVVLGAGGIEEPCKKKARVDHVDNLGVLVGPGGGGGGVPQKLQDKLENRLNGILCCAVCLDLPRNAIYQVS
jgi:hypothetical protein